MLKTQWILTYPTGRIGDVRSIPQAMALAPSERLFKAYISAVLYNYVSMLRECGTYNNNSLYFLKQMGEDWLTIIDTISIDELLAEPSESASRFFLVTQDIIASNFNKFKATIHALITNKPIGVSVLYDESLPNMLKLCLNHDLDQANGEMLVAQNLLANLCRVMMGKISPSRHTLPKVGTVVELPYISNYRDGYTLKFLLDTAPGIVLYNNTRNDISIVNFISQLSFKNGTSDNYLRFIAANHIKVRNDGDCGIFNLAAVLRTAITGDFDNEAIVERLRSLLTTTNNNFKSTNEELLGLLLFILAEINAVNPMVVGPITFKLFEFVRKFYADSYTESKLNILIGNVTTKNISEGMERLNLLLGKQTEQKVKLSDSEIYNPSSLLYAPMRMVNYDFSLLAAVKEDEFDGEIETIDEENTPDKTDNVPEGEPDVNEPKEDDDEDLTIPSIVVKVPKGSYLLKVRDSDVTPIEEWAYLLEVNNLITQVLNHPPENFTDTHRIILTRLQREYLFCLDVRSVESILSAVFKIVPKSPS